jgi:DNA-binding NarL/FixJ family response regulator
MSAAASDLFLKVKLIRSPVRDQRAAHWTYPPQNTTTRKCSVSPGARSRESLPSPPALPEEAWIEPLSRREIEVLRALAEGRSNQEIAARFVVSLNTVKKHVRTIMGKLNVKNRTQAVLLARRLRLLE